MNFISSLKYRLNYSSFILIVFTSAIYVSCDNVNSKSINKVIDITSQYENNGSFKSLGDKLNNAVKLPSDVNSEIINYKGFTLSFNRGNHTPNWVAWELIDKETDGKETRKSKFLEDKNVKGCAIPSDYTKSGYDRGHICPAADQKWHPQAMNDCFYMTNITPQDHALNSGAWSTLEKKERIWAQRDSALIIIAGPIYKGNDNDRIGETGVRVPSAFFKVIYAPYLKQPRGIGFIYPNMTSPGNMSNYSMTIDEVEAITGYDFLPNLSEEMEKEMESKTSFNLWNRN